MNLFHRRSIPQVPDRTDEIKAARAANAEDAKTARAARERAQALTRRVDVVTRALLAESTANHFTERWDKALRGKKQ